MYPFRVIIFLHFIEVDLSLCRSKARRTFLLGVARFAGGIFILLKTGAKAPKGEVLWKTKVNRA